MLNKKLNNKKICIVFSNSDISNGATRSMLDLLETWRKENEFEVIAVLRESGTLQAYLDKLKIETITVNFNGVRYNIKDNSTFYKIKIVLKYIRMIYEKFFTTWKAFKVLKKKNIDLVYSNTGAIYFGKWLSDRLHTPHFWHIRELGEEDQNERHLMGEKYFYKLLNESCHIICISNIVYNKIAVHIKEVDKVICLYNDISPQYDKIHIRNFCCDENEFNMIVIGSVIEGKSQEQVIYALKKLRDKGVPANLYIVGRDVGDYSKRLHSIVKEENLVDYVYFLGHLDETISIKNRMHVEIVPSRCEAFGRITVEAMLNGLPLIGANTGGTAELIEDNINGLIYNWGDIEMLYEKILYVYTDYNAALKRAEQAYSFAQRFTKGRSAKEIRRYIINSI